MKKVHVSVFVNVAENRHAQYHEGNAWLFYALLSTVALFHNALLALQ